MLIPKLSQGGRYGASPGGHSTEDSLEDRTTMGMGRSDDLFKGLCDCHDATKPNSLGGSVLHAWRSWLMLLSKAPAMSKAKTAGHIV